MAIMASHSPRRIVLALVLLLLATVNAYVLKVNSRSLYRVAKSR